MSFLSPIHKYSVTSSIPTSGTVVELMNESLGPVLGNDWSGTRSRGNKYYELSNHLGNVLATVSDKKLGFVTTIGQTSAEGYTAQVQSASDYYPFG